MMLPSSAHRLHMADKDDLNMRDGDTVCRPWLPPILLVALGAWVGCALSYVLLEAQTDAVCIAICLCACVGIAVCACVLLQQMAPLILVVMLGVCCGIASSSAHALMLKQNQELVAQSGMQELHIMLLEDARASSFGARCIARVVNEHSETLTMLVYLPDEQELSCWATLSAHGAMKSAKEYQAHSLWMDGCAGTISLTDVHPEAPDAFMGAIINLRHAALVAYRTFEGNGAMLVESMAFGNRQRLFSSGLYGDIKAAGLAHVVAVSGAHLGAVASFCMLLVRALRFPRGFALGIQVVLLACYLLLTGAPLSAIRAALMVFGAVGSFFAGRRAWPANALGTCILVFCLLWPAASLSLSFVFSALATLSILLFSEYLGAWVFAAFGHRMRTVADVCGMTLAAQAASVPLASGTFGVLSLVGPLASIVAMPLCAVLCVGGIWGGMLASIAPSVSEVVVRTTVELGDVCCVGIQWLASLPGACVGVAWDAATVGMVGLGVACALYGVWPQPSKTSSRSVVCGCVSCLVLMLFALPLFHAHEIVMLDVGQGDALVLRSGSSAVLVDTGTDDTKVVKGLARHDIRELDMLVITHPDDDHCGSLEAVASCVPIRQVGVARDLLTCTCDRCVELRTRLKGFEVVGLSKGDVMRWGAFSACVVSPETFTEEGGNQDSVVLYIGADCDSDGINNWTALMCGDAEAQTLHAIVEECQVGPVDILKVGHHGSRLALDEALMVELRPRLALVSVGASNRYGHPAKETIETLFMVGAELARTDELGDVSCYLKSDRIDVVSLR